MNLGFPRLSAALLLWPLAACSAPPADEPAAQVVQTTSALPTATPEELGLSGEGLARIGPAMQELIDQGTTAGIMTMVAREGRIVHWDARGWRVLDQDPLEPDDIFQIYSMTKPVTAVAALMLVESGDLALDDPVSTYIPSFGDVQVYDAAGNRPPSRPITILDLLTHTAGLTYGLFGDSPVDAMYREADLLSQVEGRDLEATVDAIAQLPLVTDPGQAWIYSVSLDVLGRVVEVASDTSLDEFFRTRIFDPLGMHDTGFFVPTEKLNRFATIYGATDAGLEEIPVPAGGPFNRAPHWLSGGGGLSSTAMDYLRFAQMLLNEGELDGVRILQSETVRQMTTNHLAEGLLPIPIGVDGMGYGLGISVVMETGAFWWAGLANTYFWIDPHNELIGFAWTQFLPYGAVPINPLMQSLVYSSMLEAVPAG